jgi:hypothetical protein
MGAGVRGKVKRECTLDGKSCGLKHSNSGKLRGKPFRESGRSRYNGNRGQAVADSSPTPLGRTAPIQT